MAEDCDQLPPLLLTVVDVRQTKQCTPTKDMDVYTSLWNQYQFTWCEAQWRSTRQNADAISCVSDQQGGCTNISCCKHYISNVRRYPANQGPSGVYLLTAKVTYAPIKFQNPWYVELYLRNIYTYLHFLFLSFLDTEKAKSFLKEDKDFLIIQK